MVTVDEDLEQVDNKAKSVLEGTVIDSKTNLSDRRNKSEWHPKRGEMQTVKSKENRRRPPSQARDAQVGQSPKRILIQGRQNEESKTDEKY